MLEKKHTFVCMELAENHKAGFVNIIGNPNVGKSTLMNALVGERLSIITNKAQTTRHRILGIVNNPDYQIVFSDTPGIIKPAYEMQEGMMKFVKEAFQDADILLYMVEVGEKAIKDEQFMDRLQRTNIPIILIINKIDISNEIQLQETIQYWENLFPQAILLPISAIENFGIEELMKHIIRLLPLSPPFYDKKEITNRPERFFVNEAIREKILLHYQKEIPYSVEIETESFKEAEKIIKISAIIHVERESQKGIIIGHQGKMLKKIATDARLDLEKFFLKKIFLTLYVKVNKDWRKNSKQLKRFGYTE